MKTEEKIDWIESKGMDRFMNIVMVACVCLIGWILIDKFIIDPVERTVVVENK